MSMYINPYQSYNTYLSLFQQSKVQQPFNLASVLRSNPRTPSFTSYIDTTVKKSQSYLTDVRKGADELKKATGTMTNRALTTQKRAVVSGDILTADVNSKKLYANRLNEQRVEVMQLAAKQVNRGESLGSKEEFGESGHFNFSLSVGYRTKNLSVQVSAGDSILDTQKKLAEEINAAKMGVTASVELNDQDGTSRLVVKSGDAGVPGSAQSNPEQAVFSLKDSARTDGKTGILGRMGVQEIDEYAQNAVYLVDGIERIASSNEVSLGSGVTATLTRTGSAMVTYEDDVTELIDSAEAFIKSFNEMIALGEKNPTTGGTRLAGDLSSLTKSYSRSLAGVGISVGSNGSLTIDSAKLEKAAQNKTLSNLFTDFGSSYSFAGRLSGTVSRMSSNPMRYYQLSPEVTPAATSNLFYGGMRVGSNSGLYTGLLLDALL